MFKGGIFAVLSIEQIDSAEDFRFTELPNMGAILQYITRIAIVRLPEAHDGLST